MSARRLWLAIIAAAASSLALTGMSHGLPPGRAWLPPSNYQIPGHTILLAERLETTTEGLPLVFVGAHGGTLPRDGYGLRWADSTWVVAWQRHADGWRMWPVDAPPGRYPLIWNGRERFYDGRWLTWLVTAEALADQVVAFDTVAAVGDLALSYGMAVRGARRWVAVSDGLRLFVSDAPHSWLEVPVSGEACCGITISALDDSTALMIWSTVDPGTGRLMWATHSTAQGWRPMGPLPTFFDAELPGSPHLRRRPSGGQWLAWSTDWNHIGISTFRDGAWTPPESLSCAYRRNFGHYTKFTDLSRDGGEYPVVSWDADNARDLQTTVCVCVPNDSGFTIADNLEGSDNGIGPVVARDRNEDVWVAWSPFNLVGGMKWTHTYTTATASTPNVTGAAASRIVSWTLSTAAPGTWWAVLRGRPGQPFAEVARVRATQSLQMSWTDTTAPAGGVLYKIRRESVDVRYQWESAVGSWPPPRFGPYLPVRDPLVIGVGPRGFDLTTLVFSGAPEGTLTIELFDLQGRIVHRERIRASGTGRDTFELRPGSLAQPLPPGIYFARATDSLSRNSNAAKILILR